MNSKPISSKRRVELQRKLSLNAVPRPPAGLAERIKADIPKYFDAEAERSRFSRNTASSMRIAASVLLAITSLSAAVFFMQHQSSEKVASMTPMPAVFAPAKRSLQEPQRATGAPAEEVRLDIREEPEAPRIEAPQPIVNFRGTSQSQIADARKKDKDNRDEDADTQVASGISGNVAGGARSDNGPAFAPQPAEAPAFTAVQETTVADAAAAPVQQNAGGGYVSEAARLRSANKTEKVTVTAEAPMLASPAAPPAAAPAGVAFAPMAKLARDERGDDSIFGISVDPQVFRGIRAKLENGSRPHVSAVDVEALVNYFAGPPAKRPQSGVSLEVEASPAPIEADGDHAILRFTIDTPAVATSALTTPAAKDARIEILLNRDSVERAHRIGANDPPVRESELHYNSSVTGLYALELRTNLRSSQVVATVRLHYVEGGKPRMLTHIVYGKDLARGWKNASRRHRLASLGAVWGETLRDMAPGQDVAKRAEELASQNPKDSRAKELAAAANASADGER